MKRKPPLKPFDFLVVAAAVALTSFSAFSVYARPKASQQVIIQGASGRAWVYPLDAEEMVAVPGPLGNTVVRIHGRRAWVESSPCDNQTCVAAGHITAEGEWVACLPNNVFLLIEGTGNDAGNVDSSAW
jgi:hypothetical protein